MGSTPSKTSQGTGEGGGARSNNNRRGSNASQKGDGGNHKKGMKFVAKTTTGIIKSNKQVTHFLFLILWQSRATERTCSTPLYQSSETRSEFDDNFVSA